MRCRLWPGSDTDHRAETADWFAGRSTDSVVFVAERDDGALCGFVEAGTRPCAEGCVTSPVAFVEGWWVEPGWRRRGAVRAWARDAGLSELASDAALDNPVSLAAHAAVGFSETERIACFRQSLVMES